MKNLVFGSRSSQLALAQVTEIKELLEKHAIDCPHTVQTFKSRGDVDKQTPLTANVGADYFTDVLDHALINKEIDLAIHSAKDLPNPMPPGLSIFALTASADETDAFVGRMGLSEMKVGHKIGTSSTLRRNAITAYNPRVETVPIRGTIEERIAQVDDGTVDGVIIATIALKRLGLKDRIHEVMPWEGFPLQGQLALVGRSDDHPLRTLLEPLDVRAQYGQVTLVGAGPGDPDLITLKGVKALAKADCVLYDYLVHKSILNHAPQAEKIYVGKRKGAHTLQQNELSRLIREKAMQGHSVVRLKGGDPLVFGRGGDEIEYLRAYHINVDVIAGVSSATSIPSQLGIPLTARNHSSSVAFLSAHHADEANNPLENIPIPDVETVVFLMGLSKLEHIVASLLKAGRNPVTPMMIVSNGTRVDEQVLIATIGTILKRVKETEVKPPALIVVGETIKFYRPKSKPLPNILYTGTNPRKYQSVGNIIHLPMIEIRGVPLEVDKFATLLAQYEIILLTSRFAVEHFIGQAVVRPELVEALNQKDIIVIGKDTADALIQYDIKPTHIAQEETSVGVLKLLKEQYDVQGRRLLFPRSNLPNPYIKDELAKSDCQVDELIVYENILPSQQELPRQPIDRIIFTSPSTVKNFITVYGKIPDNWSIICKGPVTQKALTQAGYKSEIMLYG